MRWRDDLRVVRPPNAAIMRIHLPIGHRLGVGVLSESVDFLKEEVQVGPGAAQAFDEAAERESEEG